MSPETPYDPREFTVTRIGAHFLPDMRWLDTTGC